MTAVDTMTTKALSFDPDVRVLVKSDSRHSLSSRSSGGNDSDGNSSAHRRWICGRDEAEIKFDVVELVDAARGGYISYDEDEAGVGQYHGGEATLRGIEHLVDKEGTARRSNQRKSALEAVLAEQQKQKEEDEQGRGSKHGQRKWEAIARACEEKTEAARVEAAKLGERDARAAAAIVRLEKNSIGASQTPAFGDGESDDCSDDGSQADDKSSYSKRSLAKKFLASLSPKDDRRAAVPNAATRARSRSAHSRIGLDRISSMPNVVTAGGGGGSGNYHQKRGSSHFRVQMNDAKKTSSAHTRIRMDAMGQDASPDLDDIKDEIRAKHGLFGKRKKGRHRRRHSMGGGTSSAAAAVVGDANNHSGSGGKKSSLFRKLGKSMKRKGGKDSKKGARRAAADDTGSMASGSSFHEDHGIPTMAPDFTS